MNLTGPQGVGGSGFISYNNDITYNPNTGKQNPLCMALAGPLIGVASQMSTSLTISLAVEVTVNSSQLNVTGISLNA